MRLVSPLLKHVIYPAFHYSTLLERIAPSGACAVVNYHGVIPPDHSGDERFLDANLVTAAALRRQLQFLKRRYQIISPENFRAFIEQGAAFPPRAVLITCDDGLLNTLTDMLPVLMAEEVACLFFVTAASCSDKPGTLWYEELYHLMRVEPLNELELEPVPDEPVRSPPGSFQGKWWSTVRRASQLGLRARADWMDLLRSRRGRAIVLRPERRCRLLDSSELTRLAAAGMSIGAHTISHPVLSLCSDGEARHEIQGGKGEIERTLGR